MVSLAKIQPKATLSSDTIAQPIVGMFFSRTPNEEGYLYEKRQYREYLHDLVKLFDDKGIRLILLCEKSSYIGDGTFINYWMPVMEQKGKFMRVDELVRPALVYDKGHFTGNDGSVRMFNDPRLAQLGRNKFTQSRLFAEWMPKTEIVLPNTPHEDVINRITTEKVVLKPLDLNGGRGVQIIDKDQLLSRVDDTVVLAQEFVETKAGVAGFTDTRHDFRVYILDGAIELVSVRTPKEGSLISNTNQGGSITFYSPEHVPEDVRMIVAGVDKKLQVYGTRFYSLDFLFDGKRWWLLELNDRPGIPALHQSEELIGHFHQKFVELIKGAITC